MCASANETSETIKFKLKENNHRTNKKYKEENIEKEEVTIACFPIYSLLQSFINKGNLA